MAIIDAKGRLHGKVANYVYRTVGNTSILQSKPANIKQSLSTRESAMEFGLASNCARIIRQAFYPHALHADGSMINRLNVAVLKCIKNSYGKARGERDLHDADLKHLEGFQFNKNSPMREVLLVRPVAELGADNRIKVSIPAIRERGDLQSPQYSFSCTLRLMLVVMNFRENYYEYVDFKEITIGDGAGIPAQEWQPKEVLPAGSIALLSASLHYYGASGMQEQPVGLNSAAFSPAELLAALQVPLATEEKVAQQHTATPKQETKRMPLNGYYGEDILREMRKQREKWEKRHGKKENTKVLKVTANSMEFQKGKVFFKKE